MVGDFLGHWDGRSANDILDAARDSLLRIAVTMQTELVRSLQIAREREDAVLDLSTLHEDVVVYKRNTLNILDDLRQRISHKSSSKQSAQSYIQLPPEKSPTESRKPGGHLMDLKHGSEIPALKVPDPEVSGSKLSLGRLFSVKRGHSMSKKPSNRTISQLVVMPKFEWLDSTIQKGEEEEEEEEEPEVAAIRIDEVEEPSHPPPPPPQEPQNPNFLLLSHRVSYSALNDDYSDKIVVGRDLTPDMNDYSHSSDKIVVGTDLPPGTNDYSYLPSSLIQPLSSGGQSLSNLSSPTNSVALPDSKASFMARSIRASSFSTASSNRASIALSPHTVLGRPNKENNYWGFCKGAWTTREDPSKGFRLASRPEGMYNTITTWQCRQCAFNGDVHGKKKPYSFDTRIHVVADSGIRYKWLFLAKSHVKCKSNSSGGDSYGCVFCGDEGSSTAIFGKASTLLDHIWMEHRGMRLEIAKRNMCAFGSVDNDEDWDINIPGYENILDY